VVTGAISRVVVLDFDGKRGTETRERLGLAPHVRTGSGGSHVYFQYPGWRVPTVNAKSKRELGRLYAGLDIRADGGYAVCLGRSAKGEYSWLRSVEPYSLDILPPDLRALLGLADPPGQAPGESLASAGVAPGATRAAASALIERTVQDALDLGRNDAGFQLARSLRDQGYSSREAEKAMQEYAARVPATNQHGEPQRYTVAEALASLRQAYKRPRGGSASISVVPGEEAQENFTDLGNARRLVKAHRDDLRYCPTLGKWLVWDGKRWIVDTTGVVTRRMVAVVHQMHTQALTLSNTQARKALQSWAMKSEAEGKIRAAINLAQFQSELVITPDQLDQHPSLLNCENGTLDLRTSELRPHRREDYLTQIAGTAYDSNAECPTWHAFLKKIMDGNDDVLAFLKRAVGYTLTGQTTEQCLFMLWGTGQNGKSTFLNAIREVMSDYQYPAPFSTFLYDKHHAIRNDLAAMRGKRYVTAIEADPGDRLSESVIKSITGGEPITARFLHHEYFSYIPHYKLWLAVNDKPHIRGTSKGTWRRIRLVPFTVEIPDSEIDDLLANKLLGELSGILAWAMKGCEQWRESKLAPPHGVLAATREYQEEMDTLGAFISDACVTEPSAEAQAGALYAAYRVHCDRNGNRPLARNDFGLALKQRGFEPAKGTHGLRLWKGLGLLATDKPTGGS
jgi:putative DNA primase/helicase